jgi:hypothetical protein
MTIDRTLPTPTPDSAEFWRGCAEGDLRMQRCQQCGELNWFPRGICVNCSAVELEWVHLSGRGTVYSYSVVARPPNASFPPQYVLALVDLEEGPRMMTHLVNAPPEDLRIGVAVSVCFDRRTEEVSLPMFTTTTS